MNVTGSYFSVDGYKVTAERRNGWGSTAAAEVTLTIDGTSVTSVAEGVGPVHALDSALRGCLEGHFPDIDRVRLSDYKVSVVDAPKGTAASVRVLVEATDGVRFWNAGCVSDNIIDASFEALCSTAVMGIMRMEQPA
ncbi:MAG: alpha-isopropylmalate synthase regulatory domain-containing protein [Actinomycetota bacterium]